MSEHIDSITKRLNPVQKEAVHSLDGPLLILAGAGSGKTQVLTHRTANIIAQGKALPEHILAVTFTNKAAREMEHRIYQILGTLGVGIHEPMWISTFHSTCVRILREHIHLLDYKPFFAIYDDGDQLSMVKKVMAILNLNDKIFPPKAMKNRINNAKMLGLGPDDVEKHSNLTFDTQSLKAYRVYEEEMKRSNALDFGDLLYKTYELFRMYPDILEIYQKRFRYIMVDEYQDTNHIQYLLVKMLSSQHRNLCVVGDEDQSIYSWRGADIRNILDFEQDFPEAKTVKLEENYRSTKNIVSAASAVIRNNQERKDKTLFTSNESGEPIVVREESSEYNEARYVIQSIRQMVESGEGSYSDYAIFYRTNAQSRVLEEQLRQNSIPYKIVGGVKFYDRMEIKDILCYMRLALNLTDDIALKRIINTPTRGIGKTTVDQLEELSANHKISLHVAIHQAIDTRRFNAGTTGKLRRFLELLEKIQTALKNNSLSDIYYIILELTEYASRLKAEDTAEATARLENLEEMANAIRQFEQERGDDASLQSFLEEMALVSDQDDLKDEFNAITLMTLHTSKGLEFPYVYIVGLEEGLFPSGQSIDSLDVASVEEERRLAYVGMTRARKKLTLTYALSRRIWGTEQFHQASRFIKEIPQEFVCFESGKPSTPSFMQNLNRPQSHFNTPKSSGFESQEFPDYEAARDNTYVKGMRVRHPTFGAGSIFQTEGSGEEMKVSVLFSDNTIKKFVAKYARLEKN